ncbi:spore germination protein [Fictibacillus nanhaiensis]|uniref:spore germination protein n=1 Tax=Fictibacillus nanhaiensis TaxID=742169 RepID=UPI001C95E735|nr:spore germination protein [Fictibacillus nanhaiensis]MBY6036394.1 spore germination protein [Fictibacillus nanhaiensis]
MTFFKKPKKLIKENDQNKVSDTSCELESNVYEPPQTIEDLLKKVREPFSSTEDLRTHWVELASDKRKIALLFIDSIVDKQIIQQQILNPLFEMSKEIDTISFEKVISLDLKKQTDFTKSQELLLLSNTLIFTDDPSCYYSVVTPEKVDRDFTEPENEKVIRGSHEGFIENISSNVALIRKRLKSPKLLVKYFKLGKETHTVVAMIYVENLANPSHVKEVEKRLTSIEADAVMTPGNVEESIEDKPFSPFPQMLSTERPDRVAANLMEGRIALVYDSSPTVNVVPVDFFVFYQSPDDYNTRWILGSFFRFIRLFSFFIAISLPSFYIAIVSFHFEVIPSALVLLMKSSLENIPYPPLFEAMLMELTIELIREASVRLHTKIGSTIAIVGGLVIGDSIVKAGLVSNLMIIVVAVTAIAAYIVPSNEMSGAIRLLRFPLMLAAATLGFLGIVFCFMILFFHLCRLYSFGTPYFAPIAPFHFSDLKDTFFRMPFWKMNTRPKNIRPIKESQDNQTRKWDTDE